MLPPKLRRRVERHAILLSVDFLPALVFPHFFSFKPIGKYIVAINYITRVISRRERFIDVHAVVRGRLLVNVTSKLCLLTLVLSLFSIEFATPPKLRRRVERHASLPSVDFLNARAFPRSSVSNLWVSSNHITSVISRREMFMPSCVESYLSM